MDRDTYEQTSLPRGTVEDALEFLLPSSTVQMMLVNGSPSGVQLPASVELGVSETEPGVKGDTVSNVTKPATLETGAVVQVPLFVNTGDRIKVDRRHAALVPVNRQQNVHGTGEALDVAVERRPELLVFLRRDEWVDHDHRLGELGIDRSDLGAPVLRVLPFRMGRRPAPQAGP